MSGIKTRILSIALCISMAITSSAVPMASVYAKSQGKAEAKVEINGKKYTEKQIELSLQNARKIKTIKPQGDMNGAAQVLYFIPGIGKVLIVATGVYFLGKAAIKTGTTLYKLIHSWYTPVFDS